MSVTANYTLHVCQSNGSMAVMLLHIIQRCAETAGKESLLTDTMVKPAGQWNSFPNRPRAWNPVLCNWGDLRATLGQLAELHLTILITYYIFWGVLGCSPIRVAAKETWQPNNHDASNPNIRQPEHWERSNFRDRQQILP